MERQIPDAAAKKEAARFLLKAPLPTDTFLIGEELNLPLPQVDRIVDELKGKGGLEVE